MPITLKLGELVASRPAFERLIQQELPILAAFKIGMRVHLASDQLATYDKLKTDLIIKLGTQDKEDPRKYSIVPADANWAEYATKLSKLESQEVTIDAEPIKVAEFGTSPTISIGDIMALRAFIVE
jgi:hypothetical protein